MMILNAALYLVLLNCCVYLSREEERGITRTAPIKFGNFLSDKNKRLASGIHLVGELQVKDAPECILACVNNYNCESANFETKSGGKKRKCEIMKSDKYKSASSMVDGFDFAHFYFQTPCNHMICQNGGTCITDYQTGHYTCACESRYSGSHCENDLCGTGWEFYNGACYLVVRQCKLPSEAETYCRGQNAHLVSIHTENEHQFVYGLCAGDLAWIGLSDVVNEGTFVWEDGTSLDYTKWNRENGKNEPNNAGGNENCIEMSTAGYWNDVPCDRCYTFICKKIE